MEMVKEESMAMEKWISKLPGGTSGLSKATEIESVEAEPEQSLSQHDVFVSETESVECLQPLDVGRMLPP